MYVCIIIIWVCLSVCARVYLCAKQKYVDKNSTSNVSQSDEQFKSHLHHRPRRHLSGRYPAMNGLKRVNCLLSITCALYYMKMPAPLKTTMKHPRKTTPENGNPIPEKGIGNHTRTH